MEENIIGDKTIYEVEYELKQYYKEKEKSNELNHDELECDLVSYRDFKSLMQSLDYDISLEKDKKYNEMNIVDVINNITDFLSRIWQVHPFREGNTRTTNII